MRRDNGRGRARIRGRISNLSNLIDRTTYAGESINSAGSRNLYPVDAALPGIIRNMQLSVTREARRRRWTIKAIEAIEEDREEEARERRETIAWRNKAEGAEKDKGRSSNAPPSARPDFASYFANRGMNAATSRGCS